MQRSIPSVAATLTALALAVTPMIVAAAPASASTIKSCSDAYQVGSTKVLNDEHQQPAMSVKQYWSPSCHENFAYAFVWQSFRTSHPGTWSMTIGEIWVQSSGVETNPVANSAVDTRQAEIWSPGFAGSGRCTYAEGALLYGSYETDGKTDKRCG
ncbi:MAG: sle [Amycolatopsis sp.]|uniref:hypothetical protein n=1 Tax=Amycolatopsis sp. TaxID=37632 RepID=UPI0026210B7A|nr:hypothetical protein [Amycolatopsis sp.]MCU1681427.1 sle [Amycolatopsis sp.]